MSVTETVRAYYDALRAGEPLPPFFAERQDLVKVGITERLVGCEAVAAGLREQTETTADWTVESRDLRVTERDGAAWFSDDVFVAWTEDGARREYDSRWSGTLVRSPGAPEDGDDRGVPDDGNERGAPVDGGEHEDDGEWRFVGMHVSASH